MENYSLFLFAKLYEDIFGKSEEDYDTQFEKLSKLYEDFTLGSIFNVDTKSEYECMVDFLEDLKDNAPKKKAYIVELSVMTRVIAEDGTEDEEFIEKAISSLLGSIDLEAKMREGLIGVTEDLDVPYGACITDK